jgi:chromosome segregation ATPase
MSYDSELNRKERNIRRWQGDFDREQRKYEELEKKLEGIEDESKRKTPEKELNRQRVKAAEASERLRREKQELIQLHAEEHDEWANEHEGRFGHSHGGRRAERYGRLRI